MSCRATALHHGCTDAAARTAKVSSLSAIRAYARSRNDSRLRELRRSSLPQPCPNVATALKHESLVASSATSPRCPKCLPHAKSTAFEAIGEIRVLMADTKHDAFRTSAIRHRRSLLSG